MKKLLLFVLLLLSITFFSCSSIQQVFYHSDIPVKQCLPSFPYKDGWYGGDAAYSIKIDQERTLWLFGDTFVSEEKNCKDRIGMDVVLGTTLAISTCSANGQFDIQYYVKKKNGEFVSFFGKNEWLWPQDPFIVNATLYIPLLVVKTLSKKHAPFNFKIAGHKIAIIKNLGADSPKTWDVDYLNISDCIPPEIQAWGTTTIVHKNHVYFYPLCRHKKDNVVFAGNILARVDKSTLDKGLWDIEYFNKDGKWNKKLDVNYAKIMFPDGLSELSVRYHPDDDKWIAIYLSTKDKGRQLLYREAQKPEGPWTEQNVLIEKIPEVNEQSPLYDENTFCYAGKEHIQFSRKKNIVATYVCNSLEGDDTETSLIRKNLFLYRPVVVNINY